MSARSGALAAAALVGPLAYVALRLATPLAVDPDLDTRSTWLWDGLAMALLTLPAIAALGFAARAGPLSHGLRAVALAAPLALSLLIALPSAEHNEEIALSFFGTLPIMMGAAILLYPERPRAVSYAIAAVAVLGAAMLLFDAGLGAVVAGTDASDPGQGITHVVIAGSALIGLVWSIYLAIAALLDARMGRSPLAARRHAGLALVAGLVGTVVAIAAAALMLVRLASCAEDGACVPYAESVVGSLMVASACGVALSVGIASVGAAGLAKG